METEQEDLPAGKRCKYFFAHHWRGFIAFTVPILLLPLLFIEPNMEMRCCYVVCLMAVFWIGELLPLGITSLLPVALFPLLGVLDTATTVNAYFPNAIILFFGSLVVSLAIEYSNLHKRIAYAVLSIIGCKIYRLHFSMLFITMFVSMWISNSAATAMMCPVIKGTLEEMSAQGVVEMWDTTKVLGPDDPPYPSKVQIAFYLGVSYAASIGGLGTLIGTGTNIAFKGLFERAFPKSTTLGFLPFMAFNVPPMLVNTTLMAVGLQWQYLGLFRSKEKQISSSKEAEEAAREVIKEKSKELGKVSCHEIQVGILFIIMIILFLTRKPGIGDLKGYADIINEKKIQSSAGLSGVSFLLFALPVNYLCIKYFVCRKPTVEGTNKPVLDWSWFSVRHSWGLLYLLAGGFALAEGAAKSHFAAFVGASMSALSVLPHWFLQFICFCVAVFCTAFTSNVAMCNILIPILINLSLSVKVNPAYICFPAALGLSMAFHLPVSTPPNAIVAQFGYIRTKDMAIGGILPTLIVTISLLGFMQTWGLIIFPDLNDFPDWANSTNAKVD
ncbi:PREDICTED: protein I'm not dead yet [Bactrocera latifrons]|uniref:Protein I'm not dead yet n=2 Tax=Bactrocera latifrons TaxID=174628 RepID=A0A0K8VFP5_BACLA|nr:PREDICTED: protein I'm not dead yet [Bactrocera latifrons]